MASPERIRREYPTIEGPTAWTPQGCRERLEALEPQIGQYGWMWAVLRLRARQTGWPPRKLYPLFRRFCNPKKPFFVGEQSDGLRFLGDYRDRYSVDHMVLPDETDPLTDFLLPCVQQTRGAFLDVGANVGLVAATVARQPGYQGDVFAFEPMPETAQRAAATFALNRLENIRLFAAAVGEDDTELSFFSAPGHSDYASAHPTETHLGIDWQEVKIPCCRLDTLRAQGSIPQAGVLKIDVEGHELSVLRGAMQIIGQDKPVIVMEYNYRIAPKMGWNPQDAAGLIRQAAGQHSYDFTVLNHSGERTAFPPPENGTGIVNLVALPLSLSSNLTGERLPP